MGGAEQQPLECPNGPDRDAGAAGQRRGGSRHPPVRAPAGCLLGLRQGRAEHEQVRAGRNCLGKLAATPHASVGHHRHIAAGLGQVGVSRRRDVADRGDLGHPDAEHLARRAGCAGAHPDEDRGGALLHQLEGCFRAGRVADGDGDGHEAGELFERQRVVAARQVPRAADLALDEEQVRAVLRAERPEPASRGRRRRYRRARSGAVDLLDTARNELLADR